MNILMMVDNPMVNDARVEKEAASLKEAGHHLTIFAMECAGMPETEIRDFGTVSRVLSACINRPFSSQYKRYKRKFQDEIAASAFDVIHCHDYVTLVLVAEIKKRRPDIFLVYDAHEFLRGWPWYKDIPPGLNRLKGKLVWRRFVTEEKKSIQFADRCITVSESIAQAIQNELHLAKKPAVLRNIPEHCPLPGGRYFHEKYKLPANALVMVHSGNLYHSPSRIRMLLESIEPFPDLYLVLIGNSEKIRNLQRAGAGKRVFFHEYVERKKLCGIISSADFGIVHTWRPRWPSHWNSLPNRIMEYSVAGIPIAATAQPEFMKLASEFGHVSLYMGDEANSLKEAITSLLNNMAAMKRAAMRARDHLSWEKESEVLIALYDSIRPKAR
jgi:glycosyltransferase involved in cell wall biosynthesis